MTTAFKQQLIEKLTYRIRGLMSHGQYICADYQAATENDILCARCGYTADVHTLRDCLEAFSVLQNQYVDFQPWATHTLGCEKARPIPPVGIPLPQTDKDRLKDVWRWNILGTNRIRIIRTHTCGMQDKALAKVGDCPGCSENFHERDEICTCGLDEAKANRT